MTCHKGTTVLFIQMFVNHVDMYIVCAIFVVKTKTSLFNPIIFCIICDVKLKINWLKNTFYPTHATEKSTVRIEIITECFIRPRIPQEQFEKLVSRCTLNSDGTLDFYKFMSKLGVDLRASDNGFSEKIAAENVESEYDRWAGFVQWLGGYVVKRISFLGNGVMW